MCTDQGVPPTQYNIKYNYTPLGGARGGHYKYIYIQSYSIVFFLHNQNKHFFGANFLIKSFLTIN